ncbi:hypothetical protein QVD17_27404 [Tagetes erecta]|uniref:Legume lectin domain-containing protein n=1 Tax=Tagetes erecta TaxID=13708 RepID=A0AAD8NRN9_TARER|nr:hypothetical protein QVD17_27404 [Tagetes erecta]
MHMAILIYFLLFLIPQAASITFDMTNISPQNQFDLVTTGDASISTAGIQLTPDEVRFTKGRAIYVKPLHLWDNSSTELASFSTQFSFVVESRLFEDFYADGFTFFLADNNSIITDGGALGLPVDNTTHISQSPFVAMEFDTLWNSEWDPANSSLDEYHVGINVNSLNSSQFKKWSINITRGAYCQANITYDHSSKNLTFSVSNIEYGVIELNYIIDLRRVLPERVIFGFSGATGIRFEKITIKSWTFNSSSLRVDEEKTWPSTELPPTARKNRAKGKGKSKTGRMVGLVVGLCVVLTLFAVCAICFWRNKQKRAETLELGYDGDMNKDFEMGTAIECKGPEKQMRLIEWVWELYGNQNLLEAVDPRLGLDFEEEEIKRLMIVGLWCVHPNMEDRPSMAQVYHVLNSKASLPELPSRMPVASYSIPPMTSLVDLNSSKESTFSTSLSAQNLNRDHHIVLEGDGASISDDGTGNMAGSNAGREPRTYIQQLYLWKLASFSTNFTFVIDSNGSGSYGYGLTFFLAQNNSDTFTDYWDPKIGRGDLVGDHVAIDVSSVSSAKSVKWFSNCERSWSFESFDLAIKSPAPSPDPLNKDRPGVQSPNPLHKEVPPTASPDRGKGENSNAGLKNLSVSFTGFQNNRACRQDGLYYIVDLSQVLPEWVIFGFSAATGALQQNSKVRSWTFDSSNLPSDEIYEVPPTPSPDPVNAKKGNVSLVVGLVVGISVTTTLVGVFGFVLWWKKNKKNKKETKEETGLEVDMNNNIRWAPDLNDSLTTNYLCPQMGLQRI